MPRPDAYNPPVEQVLHLPEVGHIHGGFGAWKQAGAPVAQRPEKDKAAPAG